MNRLLFVKLMALLTSHVISYGQNISYDQQGRIIEDPHNDILKIEWNNLDKVSKVITKQAEIHFFYDSKGNRVSKCVKPKDERGMMPPSTWKYTYYHYDGVGMMLLQYSRSYDKVGPEVFTDILIKREQTVDNGRIKFEEGAIMESSFTATERTSFEDVVYMEPIAPLNSLEEKHFLGEKQYELTNHMKSVSSVITDRKKESQPELVFTQDYYPFGMTLAEREEGKDNYFYGFNNQERISEIDEEHYTATYWEYDSRLAKRWNLDPVIKPDRSGYSVLSNSPLMNIDPHGDDDYFSAQGELVSQTDKGSNIFVRQNDMDVLFSDMNLESSDDRFTAKKILAHYSNKLGIETSIKKPELGWFSKEWYIPYWIKFPETSVNIQNGGEFIIDPNRASLMTTDEDLNISLNLINGKMSPLLGDYHNLMSTIFHEYQHVLNFWGTHVPADHVKVHITQMNHSTFKNTTLEYKISEIGVTHSLIKEAMMEYKRNGMDIQPIIALGNQFEETSKQYLDARTFFVYANGQLITPALVQKYIEWLHDFKRQRGITESK